MLNDPFVHEQAGRLADRLAGEADEPAARIERAFLLAFGRPPTEAEVREGLEYLDRIDGPLRAAGIADAGRPAGRLGELPARPAGQQRVRVRRLRPAQERSPDAHSPSSPTHPPPVRPVAGRRLAAAAGDRLRAPGGRGGPARDADPLAPRPPHFPGKAKRVIFLFMTGGVSHLDTFDPKPKLRGRRRQAVQGPKTAPAAAVQVHAAPASAARRSATCSRTSPPAWTTSA